MPRIRSTPETIASAHSDQIDFFAVQIRYSADGTPVAAETEFSYGVSNRDENGQLVRNITEGIKWPDIPPAAKVDLLSIYNKVLAHAESKGHIGAGDDEGDLG